MAIEKDPQRDSQREPTHPGKVLRTYMEADGWANQEELAEALEVSRQLVNEILNGKRGISPETAIRLSIVFDNTDPEFWKGLDTKRKLWEEQQEKSEEFEKLKRSA